MSRGCEPAGADRRTSEQGFTLLELIVTLGLLALIVAAIMGGLGAGRRVWQLRNDLESLTAIDAARSVLEARLADAMPVGWQSRSGGVDLAFAGAGDAVTFVAPLERSSSGSGLFREALRLAPAIRPDGSSRPSLVIEEAVFDGKPAEASTTRKPRRLVLVENVTGLTIRYIDPTSTNQPRDWRSTWNGQQTLPRLIGISVTFPPGDPRHWPELVIVPRAAPAS